MIYRQFSKSEKLSELVYNCVETQINSLINNEDIGKGFDPEQVFYEISYNIFGTFLLGTRFVKMFIDRISKYKIIYIYYINIINISSPPTHPLNKSFHVNH